MSLPVHLSIHVFFALLAGFIVWLIWKKPLVSFIAGILGGVLVDLDHFIDYFLAFGFSFDLRYFNSGMQFLKSDRILILFHAWEYVLVLAIIALLFKNRIARSFFLALSIGLLFHLTADVLIDHMPIKSYSITYRLEKHFQLEPLVTPENYAEHIKQRLKLGLN